MTKFYLVIFWIVAVAAGSVVLPALGFAENYLVLSLMIASLVFWGPQTWLVLWTVVLALIYEIMIGFHLGSIALPFIFCALIFYLAGHFLNIRPLKNVSSSLAIFTTTVIAFILEIIYSIIFFIELHFWGESITIESIFHTPITYLYLFIIFVVYFLLFKIIYRERRDRQNVFQTSI